MKCASIEFSNHAYTRMFRRRISFDEVEQTVENGKAIKIYTDDKPYPSRLILHFIKKRPIHVVISRDEKTGNCFVITVYEPESDLWNLDFTEKI